MDKKCAKICKWKNMCHANVTAESLKQIAKMGSNSALPVVNVFATIPGSRPNV